MILRGVHQQPGVWDHLKSFLVIFQGVLLIVSCYNDDRRDIKDNHLISILGPKDGDAGPSRKHMDGMILYSSKCSLVPMVKHRSIRCRSKTMIGGGRRGETKCDRRIISFAKQVFRFGSTPVDVYSRCSSLACGDPVHSLQPLGN